MRNLREELTFAARDMHRRGTPPPRGSTQGGSTQGGSTQGGSTQGGSSHGRTSHGGSRPPRNGAPPGGRGWADPGTYRDLEQLARRFTRELRAAAAQAQAVSEDAVGDLRAILDDALDRIKAEVFGAPAPGRTPRPPRHRPPRPAGGRHSPERARRRDPASPAENGSRTGPPARR